MSEQQMTGKEWLDRWVEALRSGKYRQGQSKLYNYKYESYCCLGVLGTVCGQGKEILALFTIPDEDDCCNWWPLSDLYVGIPESSFRYKKGDLLSIGECLATLNDYAQWTFDQIADWLDSPKIRRLIENHIDGGGK